MFLLRKFKDILLLLKKNKPQAYYFSWVLLIFLVVYFLNISFDGIIFFIILTSFFILKIPPKITAVLTLSLLVLSFTFLVILKDKPLGELSAIYAYLSLGIIIVIGAKILLGKEKNKKDNRLPLKTLRNINSQKVNIFILLLLTFALFQKTLVTGGMIESGDLSFALYPERVLGSLSLWNNYGSMAGATAPNLFPFAAINFVLSSFFHLSGELTIKLVILELVLLGLLSSYFLAKKIFQPYTQNKNHLALCSSLVAIFYLFNPYSENRIFHLHIWAAYLFFPLILLLFLKLLESQKTRYVIILAFILSFISFSPHYLIYTSLALGLLTITEIISFFGQRRTRVLSPSILLKNIAHAGLLIFCFLLFSGHWLAPYLKTTLVNQKIQTPSYILTREYIEKPLGSQFKSILEILSLKGMVTESRILNFFFKIFIFALPFILLSPFLIYITIQINSKRKSQENRNKVWVMSLKYKPSRLRNKYTIFFSLLGILAAIISTMPIWHYTLYQKILFDLPYFRNFNWLFRESFRICGLLALSYSFLLGFLFLKLLNFLFHKNNSPGKKYYPYLISGLFILLLWVYLQGTIGKVLFDELVPVKIPKEFYSINAWLKKQKGDFRVAWLPPQFDARILEWNPDHKINDFATISSGKPTIGPQAPYSKPYYLFLEKVIDNVPYFNRFFDILNTQYIIFRKDLPEDYSQSLLQNFRADSELAEVNLEKIDSHFFCSKIPLNLGGKEGVKEEFFTQCGKKKEQESYLNVFQNKDFAPLLWVPQNINLVVGGMEAWEILNSQENFNPEREALIFANQEANLLSRTKDLKFKNIIFNNSDFQDLVFSLIEKKYIVEPSSLTQEKKGEWRKASTQEPLHGEWHEVINELRVPNWDFDFGKGLIYSERTGEKIIVPLPRGDQEKYFLIIRYFQNNRGGEFKLILENEEKVIETSNLNNKFTLKIFNLDSRQKEGQFLTIQNEIGFNAINLIALIPEEEYQKYQKMAQEILEKNKILYLQKISREMTIEPLEFNLPREGNYEILVKSKVDQEESREEEIKGKEEKWLTTSKEKIIDLEKLKKEKSEKAIYFGDKKYILNFIPGKKIAWTDLDKRFFLQKEKIPLSQRVKPANILTVNNFLILDQGNLELKVDPSLKTLETIKISNLFPKIEILQGAGVSERRGRLITDAIKVKENQNFYLEYKFRGENLKGVDARVLFYGKDYHPIYQRTAFKAEYFMNDQKGNVEPTKFVHFFGTPRDTYYIKIEFKAEPNFEEESWFEISNFKLYSEEDLGNIEALILSEDQEEEKKEVTTKPTVKFKKNNPTRYQIFLPQTQEPFVLAFAESYDPMWKLKEKTSQNYFQKIFGSLFSKSSQEKTHFPLYSVINGFYIDPKELKTPELVLEYEPQNWFKGGLIISLVSLIISLTIFILYYLIKERYKRRDAD